MAGLNSFRDYVDTDAAAERLGIHPETVRRLIRQKEIPAMKWDGHWLIQRETLDTFAQGYDGRSGPRPKEVVKDPTRQTPRAKLRAKRLRALRDAIQTIVARGAKGAQS